MAKCKFLYIPSVGFRLNLGIGHSIQGTKWWNSPFGIFPHHSPFVRLHCLSTFADKNAKNEEVNIDTIISILSNLFSTIHGPWDEASLQQKEE
jgi:hypothetical protein